MKRSSLTSLCLPAGLLLLGLTLTNLHAVTLLSDDFSAAVRVGSPPAVTGVDRDGGTSHDYVIATNGNADMATAAVLDRAPNVASGINGNSYVATNAGGAYSVSTAFASTTLVPGSSLSLSFNIRTSTANPTAGTGAFRFGFFNSGGTIPTSNTNAFGGSGAFDGDTGYVSNITTSATGMSGLIQERTGNTAGQNIFQGSYSTFGTTDPSTNFILADTNYAATLTLTLSLDGSTVTLDSTFNGLSLSRTDAASPFKTFDSVSIFFGSQFGNATTPRSNFIDDVVVTTTTVPEPGTLLAGSAALLSLALRRRRRSGLETTI